MGKPHGMMEQWNDSNIPIGAKPLTWRTALRQPSYRSAFRIGYLMFKAKAETVYPQYTKIGGEGSQEILDALLKDIASAKKALDIQ